jgi:DNA-binding FadR family transcriptional regulator
VLEGRRQTSSWPDARTAAIRAHEWILEAVRRYDPDLARRRMLAHLADTATRLEQHIGAPAEPAAQ